MKNFKSIFILIFLFTLCFEGIAQDSTNVDSNNVIQNVFASSSDSVRPIVFKPHSPLRASLLSAVVPGLGQVYNGKRSYWKVPVIYAGLGGLVYSIWFSTIHYNFYHGALIIKDSPFLDDSHIEQFAINYKYTSRVTDLTPAEIAQEDESSFKTSSDFYRRNRDLSYLFTGVLFLAQILDASVWAHLHDFNVNEDLSLNIQPNVHFSQAYGPEMKLNLSLRF